MERPRSPAQPPIYSSAQPSPSLSAENDEAIALLVTTLLSHFWTANDPAAIRKAQIADWMEDLAEFPASVVEKSCQEWRRHNDKRPTPAAIRKLCIEARPRPLALPPPDRADAFARHRAEEDARFRAAQAHNDAYSAATGTLVPNMSTTRGDGFRRIIAAED